MREQKFKRQVEEIECPNCGGFGAVHSIFRLNRTTVRHSIHCKWCDYSDWWNRAVMPDYLIQAGQKERETWQSYLKAIDEELESEKGNPDYQRLVKTHDNWLEAETELHKAYDRWDREQKEQK